ncbi:hypothetical protein C499_09197 [Halogeometricum borinquense DSM 11551]|uniref:Uncharacterized protein n=2 Tax=Halogeometricum borinquense TaxID=60847 RepID=E4NN46_HALBP|nr:hypothetical protein [Halogeometricum borinquense]ADQ66276.1 hypothetical protein Hbor_06770 [Halogeometricum borinquense DSM 11551]ELY27735.1 hypothetical protein C499_09197 [Halogeometricum borinquense DSM 11551]RYJ14701.1 hypothetical protein ELS19_12565 [Halogeometricum borinquense]
MYQQQSSSDADIDVLQEGALRIPLPDEEAELAFHRNMANVAAAQAQKAEMLDDPQSSVVEAYEQQLEQISESYRTSLEGFAGDEYETLARAYVADERDDGLAAMAAYLSEAIWRLQQMITVSEMSFFPVILRYPHCCVINIRFASTHATRNAVRYESPEHLAEEPDSTYAETYYHESILSQQQAAESIRSTASILRDEFPDPRTTAFEDRRTGGVVSAFGRRGSEFSSALERVEPNPDRFEDAGDEPELVKPSPVAEQTEQTWLPRDATLL